MIKNEAHYMHNYTTRRQCEILRGLVKGTKAIVGEHKRVRGPLGTLCAAMSESVSLDFALTVDLLRANAPNLRAEGIEVIFHDDAGRDVELIVAS